jgi:hypothetical protein
MMSRRAPTADGMLGPLVGEKAFAGCLSALTILAVLWPVTRNWRENPKDGFPFSHYPMFSVKRAKKANVNYLVGLDADGERLLLPYGFAGAGGLNQVRRQINRAVREGRAEELCRAVAARVALEEEGEFAGVVAVRVVTGRYRLEGYFSGAREPVYERVRASCAVARTGGVRG